VTVSLGELIKGSLSEFIEHIRVVPNHVVDAERVRRLQAVEDQKALDKPGSGGSDLLLSVIART